MPQNDLPAPPEFESGVRAALAHPPEGVDPWFLEYCHELGDKRGLSTYLRSKRQLLALAGKARGRDVVDAGSGFGMVANLMSLWGARQVFAVEIHRPMVESHRRLLGRHFSKLRNVHPLRADASRLPLAGQSVDLILSIEAISHYFNVEAFMDECARVLRPGGHLLVSDGNNGANPKIRAHTEELWARLENGPRGRFGDIDIPEPMVERRERIIAERFPQLDPTRWRPLAEATSGFDRARIEAAVETHLAGGLAPDSRYRRGQCPIEPYWGYWIERLFDPRELARMLERRGFAARALPHYGGARNDLVLTANRVIRLVPSFRFARAYRIVARRRRSPDQAADTGVGLRVGQRPPE